MEPTSSFVAITAIGMVSSLGLDAAAACTAARAGLVQPRELDYEIYDDETHENVKVFGHCVGPYTLGFSELGRWVRLGSLGLRNLLARSGLDPAELARIPIYLNLPGGYYLECAKQRRAEARAGSAPAPDDHAGPSFEDLRPWYEAGVVKKTLAALDVPAPQAQGQVFFGDEAGAVPALAAAAAAIGAGRASQCIVGGVDSLVDPAWLPVCDELGLLKTRDRPAGFMPGEAAAFVLLETEARARKRGASILAEVGGFSLKRDERRRFSDTPPIGVALSEAILESLGRARGACTTFYCNVNGDPVRAFDWGGAQTRIAPHVPTRKDVVPAMAFGSTRAASGLVAACMAARSFEAGYAKSESALVWVASDGGDKGSFIVSRAARA
jgi:3-oxoacyl-(acyl-carrier-protein) synthase